MSVAIIAEYNPFHNGHIFQLKEAKKRFPHEKIIVIMSGKYVQRGEMAIASFKNRKKMALKHGADLVVELPFKYATQAAHIFAEGAIKIVHKMKINKIFFGSESNNPKNLKIIAATIFKQEAHYQKFLKQALKTGVSFPAAAGIALEKLIGHPVKLPNDILGLEYCKAIIKNHYNITPFTLKRTIDFKANKPNSEFASASYIRQLVRNGEDYHPYTPMKLNHKYDIRKKYAKFKKIVRQTSAQDLAKFHLVTEGMENLFKKHIDLPTYDQFVNRVNSRRYTSSRIQRVMLYILLKIKSNDPKLK